MGMMACGSFLSGTGCARQGTDIWSHRLLGYGAENGEVGTRSSPGVLVPVYRQISKFQKVIEAV